MKSVLEIPIFTVAEVKNRCCGHGDYRDIASISAESGPTPPCYGTKAEAEALMERMKNDNQFYGRYEIMELTFMKVVESE